MEETRCLAGMIEYVRLVRSLHNHSKVCNELGIRTFLIPGFLPSFSYFSFRTTMWALAGKVLGFSSVLLDLSIEGHH
jgi:hypothetical protein